MGFYDGFLDLCPVDQDVIAGEGDLTLIDAEATGGVALGVQVAEEDLFAQLAQAPGQVDGGGGLTDAALLVCDRDDFTQWGYLLAAGYLSEF